MFASEKQRRLIRKLAKEVKVKVTLQPDITSWKATSIIEELLRRKRVQQHVNYQIDYGGVDTAMLNERRATHEPIS